MNENEHCARVQIVDPRRPKMHISGWGINHFRRTNPWMAAWLSATTPGFGHIHLGMYAKGLACISLEIILNTFGKVNMTIFYTFTGQFEKINEKMDFNWVMIYAAIYVFGIWDSYRTSIEINKQSLLESSQSIRTLKHAMINSFALNFLDKRNPWVAAFWSFSFIGLGHLYCHRLVTGFALIGWNLVIIHFTKLPQLIMYTFTGQFAQIQNLVDYQWLLFYPSLYLFNIYDAYSSAVSYNRMFEEEQIYYLNGKYGNNDIDI